MNHYQTTIAPGGHWSLELRRGTLLRLQDIDGNGNAGLLFYNPRNLLERYNAPDTLKCQHTFKLTRGNCLYSDMGRIFASIVDDDLGWHDTVCGNSHASHIDARWGRRDYQHDRNDWHQNGHDAFLVELAKYGLGAADMAANINVFSKVETDDEGNLQLADGHSAPGSTLTHSLGARSGRTRWTKRCADLYRPSHWLGAALADGVRPKLQTLRSRLYGQLR